MFFGGYDSDSGSEGYDSEGYNSEGSYGGYGCSCGQCSGRGVMMGGLGGLFALSMFMNMAEYDPWSGRREKSSASESRERLVMRKFNDVKAKVEGAIMEKTKVTVKLGCHPNSQSILKSLPGDLIEQICVLAGLPEAKPRPRLLAVAAAAASSTVAAASSSSAFRTTDSRRSVKRINYSELNIDEEGRDVNEKKAAKKSHVEESQDDEEEEPVDLTDLSIYRSGEVIIIPLTKPNEHLTGPCWRDFSRAVRKNHGWDVKRIAATPEQKKKFKESRKGKVYFINVIFTVPGTPTKTKAKPKAKKASARTTSRPNEDASRCLRDAISSAVESATGEVDEDCLQRALDAGYSKHFILARAAEQRGDGDQKPAAKKPRRK